LLLFFLSGINQSKSSIMNLYVSNLGFNVTDNDLRKLFEGYGQVSSAKIITDRESGRSRGFGFVEMDSEKDANTAISKLNGKEMDGRALSVSVAKERENRSDRRKF
jgi:RNA recognition motif-containing protein